MADNSNIETFAKERGWVVKYANDGTPNFFYPIPKMKSSDLDPSLPNHTHPAFIIQGTEVDYRYISVYHVGDYNGGAHSLPMLKPVTGLSMEEMQTKIRGIGQGFAPKTVADSGLLLLLARKQEISNVKGNTNYGADESDGNIWGADTTVAIGTQLIYRGVLYEAIKAHTTRSDLTPLKAPYLWKELRRVGGVLAKDDSSLTLTGSGPVSWRLGGTVNGIDDLASNCYDYDFGYRIYDNELQIVEDNNAADPYTDLSQSSDEWKAILPNANDDGYTLVAPGTSGTLHWRIENNAIVLGTSNTTNSNNLSYTEFTSLTVDATELPHVPSIVYELGLLPISGDTTNGECMMRLYKGNYALAVRGGAYDIGGSSGLGTSILDGGYKTEPIQAELHQIGAHSGWVNLDDIIEVVES